ncbi:MAG TPA: tRNA lysidine(34) synthetase TilS, partial [Solirubrobacteraceae bacterium]|nr:tRNA lysidine(34) synthetase TilS [Solirubrobacteraceae bacterium]
MAVEGGVTLGALPRGASAAVIAAEVGRVLAALPHDAAAVVAVSGGPDSSALALLVRATRPDLRITLAMVRHGLHDDAAEVASAQRLAAALLDAPLEVRAGDVQRSGGGIEAAARAARYRALREVADEVAAPWLLVGHTADDQAETVLLRAARGTGVDGLGGMAPVAGDVVRPLLRVRREDLRPVLA